MRETRRSIPKRFSLAPNLNPPANLINHPHHPCPALNHTQKLNRIRNPSLVTHPKQRRPNLGKRRIPNPKPPFAHKNPNILAAIAAIPPGKRTINSRNNKLNRTQISRVDIPLRTIPHFNYKRRRSRCDPSPKAQRVIRKHPLLRRQKQIPNLPLKTNLFPVGHKQKPRTLRLENHLLPIAATKNPRVFVSVPNLVRNHRRRRKRLTLLLRTQQLHRILSNQRRAISLHRIDGSKSRNPSIQIHMN